MINATELIKLICTDMKKNGDFACSGFTTIGKDRFYYHINKKPFSIKIMGR